jgi:hypothetical protein
LDSQLKSVRSALTPQRPRLHTNAQLTLSLRGDKFCDPM